MTKSKFSDMVIVTSMWMKHGLSDMDTDFIYIRLTRTDEQYDSLDDVFHEFPEYGHGGVMDAYENEFCAIGMYVICNF